MEESTYFEILIPLGVLIRTTSSYWNNIVTQKHPILANQEELAKLTLKEPSEIRSSLSDPNIFYIIVRILPIIFASLFAI